MWLYAKEINMYAQQENVTFLDDLPNLEDIEEGRNDGSIMGGAVEHRSVPNYSKFIRPKMKAYKIYRPKNFRSINFL